MLGVLAVLNLLGIEINGFDRGYVLCLDDENFVQPHDVFVLHHLKFEHNPKHSHEKVEDIFALRKKNG